MRLPSDVHVDAEFFRKRFKYDAASGELLRFDNSVVGYICNCHSDLKYKATNIKRKQYRVHRIIWVLNKGAIPIGYDIDHINGNGLDNRMENLRLVTKTQNARNNKIYKNNQYGYPGIRDMGGYWEVRIKVNRKAKILGYVKTKEEAIKVRKEAEKKYGFITRERGDATHFMPLPPSPEGEE